MTAPEPRFVAVDLETSGLDPRVHEIIEVGMAWRGDDGQLSTKAFSLPFDEDEADPRALEVNGWGVREFAPLATYHELLFACEVTLGSAYMVGKNPAFDAAFLTIALQRRGFEPRWHHRLIDVGTLAWGHHLAQAGALRSLSTRDVEILPVPLDSETVGRIVGVEPVIAHRALDDAIWALQAFERVLRGELNGEEPRTR